MKATTKISLISITLFSLLVSFRAKDRHNNYNVVSGNWHLIDANDSDGSNFSQVIRSCDKNTVWMIKNTGTISLLIPEDCNDTNMGYLNRFGSGFNYRFDGNTLTLIDLPTQNVLNGSMGGSVDFRVLVSANRMTWELVRKPFYRRPEYSYRWIFAKY